MAYNKKVAELVASLTELSRRDGIEWEETADESTFQALVSNSLVTISRMGLDSESDYQFKVMGASGRVLEEATVSHPLSVTGEVGASWYELADLFELARRRALNVDEALSGLISSIREKLR